MYNKNRIAAFKSVSQGSSLIRLLFNNVIPLQLPLAGRLQFFIYKSPTTSSEDEQHRGEDYRPGDSKFDLKRGSKIDTSLPVTVVKHLVYCKEDGWGESTGNQSKKTECSYSLSSLQNGGVTSSEGSVVTKGLYGKARFKR